MMKNNYFSRQSLVQIKRWLVRLNKRTDNGPSGSLSVLWSVVVFVVFLKKKRERVNVCFRWINCPSCNKIALHFSLEF